MKRQLPEWTGEDLAMPAGLSAPSVDQYYRALDAIANTNALTETHLYARLTDLANLDLRLCVMNSCRRTSRRPWGPVHGSGRGHSAARVIIAPIDPKSWSACRCTGNGTPTAHHVFAGNTNDVMTLPGVLEGLQARFGVRRFCVVADRGSDSLERRDTADRFLVHGEHRTRRACDALASSLKR